MDVYIDSDCIRIYDEPTPVKFLEQYLEKLRNGQRLEAGELETLGKNIYDNVFSTPQRRDKLDSSTEYVGNQGLCLPSG